MNTYPNPLTINFGQGKIAVRKFNDKDGRGLVFTDTAQPHNVGDNCGLPDQPNHTPEEGEIYLHFTNAESAKVVHETLSEVITALSGEPDPIAALTAQLDAARRERDLAVLELTEAGWIHNPGASRWKPPVNHEMGKLWQRLIATEEAREALRAELEAVKARIDFQSQHGLKLEAERDTALAQLASAQRQLDAAHAERDGARDMMIAYGLHNATLRQALKWSVNAMQTWCSSKYSDHPETRKCQKALDTTPATYKAELLAEIERIDSYMRDSGGNYMEEGDSTYARVLNAIRDRERERNEVEKELADSKAQLARCRRDSERYQWLRNFANFSAVNALLDKVGIDTLDAAIDSALAAHGRDAGGPGGLE